MRIVVPRLLLMQRKLVGDEWLSTTSQAPQTCVSLSLLTARTASRFSAGYFPVLRLRQALRLSLTVWGSPWSGNSSTSHVHLSETFRIWVLKWVYILSEPKFFSRRNLLFKSKFPLYFWARISLSPLPDDSLIMWPPQAQTALGMAKYYHTSRLARIYGLKPRLWSGDPYLRTVLKSRVINLSLNSYSIQLLWTEYWIGHTRRLI